MKKIGIFNLIDEQKCNLKCECGWHIQVGGLKKSDLSKLKKFLKGYQPKSLTKSKKYNEKIKTIYATSN